MLRRLLSNQIEVTLEIKNKAILVIGPRQVGKSTLLNSLAPDLVINLADEEVFRDHINDPALIRKQVQALKPNKKILIDEVQRIPSILNTLQAILDQKKGWSFLITGSSARKLKRGQVNLLPGRIFRYDLYPLTYWELGSKFDLTKALVRGTLPEVYLQEYGLDLLQNYIDIYLREEIQAESLVRNIGHYSRFLNLAAEISGKILNYSQIASDSEIPKETLRRFIDILVDTLLAHRLPGYIKLNSSRKATQKEKVIIFDTGVRNAILKQHRNTFTSTQLGELFEQWIFLQLKALNQYKQFNWDFFYYRDDLKNEVDLIIDTRKKVIAVEIKWGRTLVESHLKGLRFFASNEKRKTVCYVVYNGPHAQKMDQITILPYSQFLDRALNDDL